MPQYTTTTTAGDSTGSQTELETVPLVAQQPTAILRLRAVPDANTRRIQWAEDVIDNEGLGRKKSKVCCIYHKPREAGSSSSSSSSGSDSDSSDEEDHGAHDHDDGRARMAAKGKQKAWGEHGHGEGVEDCKGCGTNGQGGRAKKKGKGNNAYETEPKRRGTREVKR